MNQLSRTPTPSEASSSRLTVELRLIFLRVSYLSILVTEIFAIIQLNAMLNNSIKASLKDVRHGIALIAVLPIIFIHHFASAFIPINSSAIWGDVVLLMAEAGFIIWTLQQGYAVINPLSDRRSPFLVLASYALLLCMLVLVILRIVDKVQGTPSFKPQKRGLWRSIRGVLSGRRLWEPHYKGERGWMIWCRAVLAISFLVLFPFYVTYSVVIQPLQNAALITVKESWSKALPPDFKDVKNARWTVVITNFPDKPFESQQKALNVLTAVTILKFVNNTPTDSCNKGSYIKGSAAFPDHIWFNCLNLLTDEIAQQGEGGITSAIKHFVLGVFADYNHTLNSTVPLMHVRMGLTSDTVAVLRETRPAILGENQNMVGEGEVFVRRELTTPRLATLGVFSGWKTYLLTDVNQYFNDPNAATRGYAGRGISTIIMNMENARYGYRVVEDYLDKTVLDGFSAIGGLFALIGSTAALLFGRSILQMMFDLKPLSLFGVLHLLDKDPIKEDLISRYPDLVNDLNTNRGYTFLLHDRILQVDVESNPTNPPTSPTNPTNPTNQ